MTSASLHQPNAFPWLKLVDKILSSDVWIAYDTAQYTRTEFHSRQLIKGRQGSVWLSIPVVTSGRSRFQALRDVEIARATDWRAAHLRLLREHYLRAPFYAEVREIIDPVYRRDHRYLVDFNVELTATLLGYLGSRTRIVRASGLPHDGDRTQRVIELNRAVGADTHLTSSYHRTAIDIDWDRVAGAGIGVRSQQFTHPVHNQLHGPFVSGLSVLDLLCNHGAASAGLMRSLRLVPVVRRAETFAGAAGGPADEPDVVVETPGAPGAPASPVRPRRVAAAGS